MTKQSPLGKTFFWTVAALSAVAVLSLGVLGSPWSKTASTDFSEDDEIKDEKGGIKDCNEESNENTELRDSSEEKEQATAQRESCVEEKISPPSTPLKTSTAKGKKWRERLSAKKQLKLKLNKKHYASELRSDSLQSE